MSTDYTENYTQETAALAEQLSAIAPQQLLVVGQSPWPLKLKTALTLTTPDALPEAQRFELSCVYHCLNDLPKASGLALLATLRDVLSEQVLVMTTTDANWSTQDFIAAGFTPHQQINHTQFFHYNIATYKRTPEWLNAQYWANPEQWDQRRW